MHQEGHHLSVSLFYGFLSRKYLQKSKATIMLATGSFGKFSAKKIVFFTIVFLFIKRFYQTVNQNLCFDLFLSHNPPKLHLMIKIAIHMQVVLVVCTTNITVNDFFFFANHIFSNQGFEN